MKILILGASQGTGALAVQAALDKGHTVTAFSRTPSKLQVKSDRLKRRAGDFHDAPSVLAAVEGHDAVIVTASALSLKGFKEKPDYFSSGTRFTIAAMKAHGVKRLVVLSALGAGDSRSLSNWFIRTLVVDGILKLPFADHGVQERLVQESGLDFVIARPGRLTDGPALGTYQKRAELVAVPFSISRADVAEFLVSSCSEDRFIGQAVQLGG